MGFLIFWLISTIITFLLSRLVVKLFLKDDKKGLDGEVGLFWTLVLLPFIPIVNILMTFVILVIVSASYVQHVGFSKVARKIFLIRLKEEESESNKGFDKTV